MSTYLVAWAIVPNDWGFEEAFTAKENKPVNFLNRIVGQNIKLTFFLR